MRVALVEPDADLRAFLTYLLRFAGHQVTAGASLATVGPDAALLTVPLLLLRVGRTDPLTRDLLPLLGARAPRPTLVLTTGEETAWVVATLGVLAQNCFPLPVRPSALRQRVATLARSTAR